MVVVRITRLVQMFAIKLFAVAFLFAVMSNRYFALVVSCSL